MTIVVPLHYVAPFQKALAGLGACGPYCPARFPGRLAIVLIRERVAGEVEEDVFEGGPADGDAGDAAGQGVGGAGDEGGAVGVLETDDAVDHAGRGLAVERAEAVGHVPGEVVGRFVVGGECDHVAADGAFEVVGGVDGDDAAAADDGEAVAAVGLVHEVGGEGDGDAAAVAEQLEVRPHVPPRGGVEAGRGLVHQEQTRLVQQRLGEFDPPPHAAAEFLDVVLAPIGQAELVEVALDAGLELGAGHAEEPAVVAEVLLGGEFDVEAGALEDDAEALADGVGLGEGVAAEDADDGARPGGSEHGGDDAEEGGLAPAVGAEDAEDLALGDGEVDAVERGAVGLGVGVREVLDVDGGGGLAHGWGAVRRGR